MDMSDFEGIKLSLEQERALTLMLSGRNVFLTGEAGTGKSAVIHAFKRRCGRRLVCLAPTGLAALLIGGETIHRFFRFQVCVLPVGPLPFMDELQRRRLDAVDTVLIDEVSMVRSDVFQAIDTALRHAAPPGLERVPFGGKQIIVVGDYFQLGPIAREFEITQYLQAHLGGMYSFCAPAWAAANFANVVLRQVHRQKDRKSLEALNAIRTGNIVYAYGDDIHDKSFGDFISLVNKECFRPGVPVDPAAVALCATRDLADYINRLAISSIPGVEFVFNASIDRDFPWDIFPTDNELRVKIGERVMLIANDSKAGYVNGDVGVVVDVPAEEFAVKVRLDRGIDVIVRPFFWDNFHHELTCDANGMPALVPTIVGRFSQIPLIPAYAITTHKSQGKTLDAVRLVLGNVGCFATGQLYVALSRCRNLKRLSLDRPIAFEDCIVDPAVLAFYREIDPTGQYCACPLCLKS